LFSHPDPALVITTRSRPVSDPYSARGHQVPFLRMNLLRFA
jgi:hypothetical protein